VTDHLSVGVLGWEHTFIHENDEFLRAVAVGREYAPDFTDGLVAQRVLDTVRESDVTGEWVTVER